MQKKILLTGATDGIGRETAGMLYSKGHHVLLHGRNPDKLGEVEAELAAMPGEGRYECLIADLSQTGDAFALSESVKQRYNSIDVLINNAGVYHAAEATTREGLDVRFAVNTLAPYILSCELLPLLGSNGRVINLSSAAQSSVDLAALKCGSAQAAGSMYAQSKLALTMWSRHLAQNLNGQGPAIIAVNPGSMLGSKMVKQAYGVAGGDIRIGAEILCRAALDAEFADANGLYYDNDRASFASPHPDALDEQKVAALVQVLDDILKSLH